MINTFFFVSWMSMSRFLTSTLNNTVPTYEKNCISIKIDYFLSLDTKIKTLLFRNHFSVHKKVSL